MKYLLYAACAFLYARTRPLRQQFLAVGRAQQIVVVVIVGGFFYGQIARKVWRTYPLVSWGMYSGMADRVSYDEFVAVRADGSEFILPICDFVRTRDQRTGWLLRILASDVERTGDEDLRRRYDAALRSAWGLYHRRHPALEVSAIRVYAIDFPTAEFRGRSAITRRLRWEVRP